MRTLSHPKRVFVLIAVCLLLLVGTVAAEQMAYVSCSGCKSDLLDTILVAIISGAIGMVSGAWLYGKIKK